MMWWIIEEETLADQVASFSLKTGKVSKQDVDVKEATPVLRVAPIVPATTSMPTVRTLTTIPAVPTTTKRGNFDDPVQFTVTIHSAEDDANHQNDCSSFEGKKEFLKYFSKKILSEEV